MVKFSSELQRRVREGRFKVPVVVEHWNMGCAGSPGPSHVTTESHDDI